MTSKLICPVCGAGEVLSFPDGTFACDSEYCPSYDETDSSTYDLLIKIHKDLEIARKALDYCIERFKSLENVLDEKAEASDIPDNPDLYAWAVRIKPIWGELKEITGIDYTTEHK